MKVILMENAEIDKPTYCTCDGNYDPYYPNEEERPVCETPVRDGCNCANTHTCGICGGTYWNTDTCPHCGES